jgi:hypothetical protein
MVICVGAWESTGTPHCTGQSFARKLVMLATNKSPAQILTLNDWLAPFKFGFSARSQSLIATMETGNWNLAIGTKVHPVSRSTVIMYRVKSF